MAFDQQPVVGVITLVRPMMHAHQRPFALQLFAFELEAQMAFLITALRVFQRLPYAAIPHHHLAGTVLMRRNHAFKIAVGQRMVFYMHGQTFYARIKAGAFGHGPAFEHAIQFQPEVVMQAGGVVFLNYIMQYCARRPALPPGSEVILKSRLAR